MLNLLNKNHSNNMADATNPQGLTVQQMSQAAASPQQFGLNPQGLTAQQMGQMAENQMKTATIQQAQAQPGTLVTGGQLGATPTGQLPQQPVMFQAQTTTPESQRQAGIQEVARLNNISLEEAGARYDRATNRPTNLPPGTVYNPATGQVTDPRTGMVYAGSTGPDYSGLRFVDQATAQNMGLGAPGAPGGVGMPSGPSGLPGAPSTAPTGSFADQLADINSKTDQAFATYKQSMDQLQSGTFPLSPSEQAQVQALQGQIDAMSVTQKDANSRYQGGLTQVGISSGRARYAPEIQMGNFQGAVNAGLAKIRDIEMQGADSMSKLKEAFKEKNYAMINEQYEKMTGFLEKKSSQIASIMKMAQDHEEKMIELNQKAEQQQIENTLKMADFDSKQKQQAFDNMMSSDKFTWTQKQDGIKNMMDSDKFTWSQKQDMIKNALDQGRFGLEKGRFGLEQEKFGYQQEKDLQNYLLDVEKMERADTPNSYKEWKLSGQPGNYADWLKKEKVSSKPPTADQSTAGILVQNMKQGNDTIDLMTDTYAKNLSTTDFLYQEKLPDFMKSQEFKRFEQSARAFAEGWLRKTSGAAISEGEWSNAFKQFLPQAGDGPELLAQKKRARQGVMGGMADAAGPAISEDFRSSIKSGKTTYYSIDDYAKANPTQVEAIDKIGKEHPNWSDDDILQILQTDESGGEPAFSKPPSTGLKGSLSLSFESGGDPGVIGYDRTGGYSYGLFQLAHNNAKSFIQQSPYAEEFQGLAFNSPAWREKWKKIANEDQQGFAEAQTNYITKTHVDPQLDKLLGAGLKVDQYSPALKEVILSTAVQHGPATDVVLKAAKRLGKGASEEDLIKAIYKERWGGGRRFASSTSAVRKGVYNRFFGKSGEMNKALALAKSYNA